MKNKGHKAGGSNTNTNKNGLTFERKISIEPFLMKNKYMKKIMNKNQNCDGSVDEKLKTGKFNKREYELMLNNTKIKFDISYSFCVSKFLQNKMESKKNKYINLQKILLEDNIKIFYAENDNYHNVLYNWITMI
jgi:hypothetical protein